MLRNRTRGDHSGALLGGLSGAYRYREREIPGSQNAPRAPPRPTEKVSPVPHPWLPSHARASSPRRSVRPPRQPAAPNGHTLGRPASRRPTNAFSFLPRKIATRLFVSSLRTPRLPLEKNSTFRMADFPSVPRRSALTMSRRPVCVPAVRSKSTSSAGARLGVPSIPSRWPRAVASVSSSDSGQVSPAR